MKITIKNSDIQHYNDSSVPDFPKYTSQLMNWANQNAQGTRPRVVGQLSELFPQYRKECGDGEEISIGGWERWYSERYPDSIDEAADKIGADASRYIFASSPMSTDVRFGFTLGDGAKRIGMGLKNSVQNLRR